MFLAGAVDPANRYPTEQERAAMREFPSRAEAFAYLVELSQGEYPARSGKRYRIYDAARLLTASRSDADRDARRTRLAEIRAQTGCSASYAYVLLRKELAYVDETSTDGATHAKVIRQPSHRGPKVNVAEKIVELELRLAKLRRRLAELPARIEDLEAQLRRYAGSTQQPPMKPEVA